MGMDDYIKEHLPYCKSWTELNENEKKIVWPEQELCGHVFI